MTESTDSTETVELDDEQRAALITALAEARDADEHTEVVLKAAKEKIKPQEAARKAARLAHDAAKEALRKAMKPGEKWTAGTLTVTLSAPKEKLVDSLDTAALIEYIKRESPELIAHFTRSEDRTPVPSVRLTDTAEA